MTDCWKRQRAGIITQHGTKKMLVRGVIKIVIMLYPAPPVTVAEWYCLPGARLFSAGGLLQVLNSSSKRKTREQGSGGVNTFFLD